MQTTQKWKVDTSSECKSAGSKAVGSNKKRHESWLLNVRLRSAFWRLPPALERRKWNRANANHVRVEDVDDHRNGDLFANRSVPVSCARRKNTMEKEKLSNPNQGNK
jgi:hypothetical protein